MIHAWLCYMRLICQSQRVSHLCASLNYAQHFTWTNLWGPPGEPIVDCPAVIVTIVTAQYNERVLISSTIDIDSFAFRICNILSISSEQILHQIFGISATTLFGIRGDSSLPQTSGTPTLNFYSVAIFAL